MKDIRRLFKVATRGLYTNSLGYDRTLEAIGQLSDCIDNHDGGINWNLESEECTLDSLLVGAYWFCSDYHGGMQSDEYKLLCRIGRFFDPGCTTGPEPDSTEVYVYEALEALGNFQ